MGFFKKLVKSNMKVKAPKVIVGKTIKGLVKMSNEMADQGNFLSHKPKKRKGFW